MVLPDKGSARKGRTGTSLMDENVCGGQVRLIRLGGREYAYKELFDSRAVMRPQGGVLVEGELRNEVGATRRLDHPSVVRLRVLVVGDDGPAT